MAADLIRRPVNVLVATTTQAALAAKAATTEIPIDFELASNPVKLGLVASLNRPGGNVTGVTQLNIDVTPKRLEVMRELIPAATLMAALVNPANPTLASPPRKTCRQRLARSGCNFMFRIPAASANSRRLLVPRSNCEQVGS